MINQPNKLTPGPVTRIFEENPLHKAETILKASYWAKQREIHEAIKKHSIVSVRSCHAIGKSYVGGKIAVDFLTDFPDNLVWTTAPTARQVYNILWREIRSTVNGATINLGGELLKQRYELGDNWYAFGFATDTPEAFQGLHAKSGKILGIVDEASGVDDAIFEGAESTLTSQGARLLMLGNANKKTGYFARSFTLPNVYKIKITCFDTPNFIANNIHTVEDLKNADVENCIIVAPYLITPKFAKHILDTYGETSNNFLVRCLAEFPAQDVNTLIGLDLIEKAFYRDIPPDEIFEDEEIVISCDPARYGDDRTGILVRQGLRVTDKITIRKHATTAISGRLINMRRTIKSKVPEGTKVKIKIDTIGLGAGVYDEVLEKAKSQGWEEEVYSVNVAESAINEEEYANHRTEIWFLMRDWLKVGSLPKDDDFLEGAEVKYKFDSKGRNVLESKDDIKKRIKKSPDIMDALAISFSEKDKTKEPNIRFL